MQEIRRGDKMIVAVCVDDNYGMLFNKRRQSRDNAVLMNIAQEHKRVWIHTFSEKMFVEYAGQSIVDDDFLTKAGEEEICFVENQLLKSYENKIEEVIIYKWNRKYPTDFKFDLNLTEWKLVESVDFTGNSHEKITKERYQK